MSGVRLYVELPSGFKLSLEDYDAKVRVVSPSNPHVGFTIDADELWAGLQQLMHIRRPKAPRSTLSHAGDCRPF